MMTKSITKNTIPVASTPRFLHVNGVKETEPLPQSFASFYMSLRHQTHGIGLALQGYQNS